MTFLGQKNKEKKKKKESIEIVLTISTSIKNSTEDLTSPKELSAMSFQRKHYEMRVELHPSRGTQPEALWVSSTQGLAKSRCCAESHFTTSAEQLWAPFPEESEHRAENVYLT